MTCKVIRIGVFFDGTGIIYLMMKREQAVMALVISASFIVCTKMDRF